MLTGFNPNASSPHRASDHGTDGTGFGTDESTSFPRSRGGVGSRRRQRRAEAEEAPPSTSLADSTPDAAIIDGLTYDRWCKEPVYRLETTNRVRELLRRNQKVLLRSPLESQRGEAGLQDFETFVDDTGTVRRQDETDAVRNSRLVLQSVFTENMDYCNSFTTPAINTFHPRQANPRTGSRDGTRSGVVLNDFAVPGGALPEEAPRSASAPVGGSVAEVSVGVCYFHSKSESLIMI